MMEHYLVTCLSLKGHFSSGEHVLGISELL